MKDRQGRYFHQGACLNEARRRMSQRATGAAAPAAAAASQPEDIDPSIAAMVDEALSTQGDDCPSCRSPLKLGAVVCMSCGFNVSTGKAVTTSVTELKRSERATGGVASARSAAARAVDWPIAMGLAAAGASAGGVLGALVWGGIIYALNAEVGWVAVLVGAACGIGASLGAQKHTGVVSGVAAAVVSLMAIFGGKVFATSMFLNDFRDEIEANVQVMSTEWMTDEDALVQLVDAQAYELELAGQSPQYPRGKSYWEAEELAHYPSEIVEPIELEWDALTPTEKDARKEAIASETVVVMWADEIAVEREGAGETLAWPDGMTYDDAFEREDYPEDVLAEAQARWDGMSREDKVAAINENNAFVLDAMTSSGGAAALTIASETNAMSILFNLLWIVLAVGAAFKLGSGMGADE